MPWREPIERPQLPIDQLARRTNDELQRMARLFTSKPATNKAALATMLDATANHGNTPMRKRTQATSHRRPTSRSPQARESPTSIKALDALIAEATDDAYDDNDLLSGFQLCLDKHLALPFTTTVLGVPVQVTGFAFTDGGHIVALCTSGKLAQYIPLLDLPLPKSPPAGHEWIAAYRRWCRWR
jgi:hypothetical protein